jgi:hypothetical protein
MIVIKQNGSVNPNETVSGTVEATNPKGIKVAGRWLNYSQYDEVPHPVQGRVAQAQVDGNFSKALEVSDAAARREESEDGQASVSERSPSYTEESYGGEKMVENELRADEDEQVVMLGRAAVDSGQRWEDEMTTIQDNSINGNGAAVADPSDDLVKILIDTSAVGPFACETLWARPLGDDLYELANSPVLADDMHLRDVVRAVEPCPDMFPQVVEVVHRSGHKTVRFAFQDNVQDVAKVRVLCEVSESGAECKYGPPVFVFDVPPQADYEAVCDYLWTCGEEGLLWLDDGTAEVDAEPC